jgi:hypothetical protein
MTVFGMIVVNAFKVYKYTTKDIIRTDDKLDFNSFLWKLAYELIFNKFIAEDRRNLRRRSGYNTPNDDQLDVHRA